MKNNTQRKIEGKERLSTLERAIKVLEYLETSQDKSRLSDIADTLGIPFGTTFNILRTLERYNLIDRNSSTKQYRLGFKLFQLGNHVDYIRELREVSLPFMRELTRESGETSHLGILFEESLYFLEIIESPFTKKTRAIVGTSLPLHAPAVGKVLLSFQPEEERKKLLDSIDLPKFTTHTIIERGKLKEEVELVVNQGYAVDNEEVFLGTTCIAAPIFNSSKKICAALGITGDSSRINKNKSALVNIIQHEALNISFKLGYQLT
ncbi:MAG: IclR family transcriptional regulator [Atribacterota bacterium]|jgi:DNA-binding IclR family transcriptional regulator|nr:IclR family transcriptional regulator [Atribacterota bacterium]MDD4896929.1 IclR family transcriptional regulator [Atribacterota bacterium]MDD5636960.1 IclR family transcriptional regulator [Atribacterota bacterium]